jgi:hypothetical protein
LHTKLREEKDSDSSRRPLLTQALYQAEQVIVEMRWGEVRESKREKVKRSEIFMRRGAGSWGLPASSTGDYRVIATLTRQLDAL